MQQTDPTPWSYSLYQSVDIIVVDVYFTTDRPERSKQACYLAGATDLKILSSTCILTEIFPVANHLCTFPE